jgi:RHS repeat-associated protein
MAVHSIRQLSLSSMFARVAMVVLLFAIGAQSAVAERKTTYYHIDVLGSVVAASDQSGQLLWRKEYAPFGDQLDSTAEQEKLAFTGKEHDDLTGLTYFGARYYDPYLGRFMGVDPAGVNPNDPFSFNRYSYGHNNPYRFIDPDGRQSVDTSCDEACQIERTYRRDAAPLDDGAKVVRDTGSKISESVDAEMTSPMNYVPFGGVVRKLEKFIPKRFYSARELLRRVQDPGPFHNFPETFNDDIFRGTRTVVKSDYVLYTKRGTLTLPGKEVKDAAGNIVRQPAREIQGTYEIGVEPSASGRNEKIVHRMFRPDKKE